MRGSCGAFAQEELQMYDDIDAIDAAVRDDADSTESAEWDIDWEAPAHQTKGVATANIHEGSGLATAPHLEDFKALLKGNVLEVPSITAIENILKQSTNAPVKSDLKHGVSPLSSLLKGTVDIPSPGAAPTEKNETPRPLDKSLGHQITPGGADTSRSIQDRILDFFKSDETRAREASELLQRLAESKEQDRPGETKIDLRGRETVDLPTGDKLTENGRKLVMPNGTTLELFGGGHLLSSAKGITKIWSGARGETYYDFDNGDSVGVRGDQILSIKRGESGIFFDSKDTAVAIKVSPRKEKE